MNARCNLAAPPSFSRLVLFNVNFMYGCPQTPLRTKNKMERKAKIQTDKKSEFTLSKIYQGNMHDVPVSRFQGSSCPPKNLPHYQIKQNEHGAE